MPLFFHLALHYGELKKLKDFHPFNNVYLVLNIIVSVCWSLFNIFNLFYSGLHVNHILVA